MVPAFLPRCLDCRRVFFAPFLDCLETKHLEKKEGKFRARRIYQRVEVVESVLMWKPAIGTGDIQFRFSSYILFAAAVRSWNLIEFY